MKSIFNKLLKLKLPQWIINLAIIVFSTVIASGYLFCIVNWRFVSEISASVSAMGKAFAFELGLSPLGYQTLQEVFFLSFLYISSFIGLLIIHDAATKPREAKEASILSLIGIFLLIASIIGFWWIAVRVLRL